MPIYEYLCETCGEDFEVIQKFSDAPLKRHNCAPKSKVRRKLSLNAFQLKGGGWYSEGYGKNGGAANGGNGSSEKSGSESGANGKNEKAAESSGSSSGESKTGSDSSTKTESKPASKDSGKSSGSNPAPA